MVVPKLIPVLEFKQQSVAVFLVQTAGCIACSECFSLFCVVGTIFYVSFAGYICVNWACKRDRRAIRSGPQLFLLSFDNFSNSASYGILIAFDCAFHYDYERLWTNI